MQAKGLASKGSRRIGNGHVLSHGYMIGVHAVFVVAPQVAPEKEECLLQACSYFFCCEGKACIVTYSAFATICFAHACTFFLKKEKTTKKKGFVSRNVRGPGIRIRAVTVMSAASWASVLSWNQLR
jgi:hypothetical protein